MRGRQEISLSPTGGRGPGGAGVSDVFQPLTLTLSPFQGRGDFIVYQEGYLQGQS
jgi:hypothetical protein